jgi:N4-gp56 family major capsid protein
MAANDPTLNPSTTSSLQYLIAPMVQESLFVASETSIMRGLVRNYPVPMNSGKVLQVPIYGTQSAADVNEATDLDNTAITNTKKDITLKEIGIMTTVTDFARNVSESNVIADLGRLFGEAISKKIDQDLTALFSGFSTGYGSAQDEITVEMLFKAYAQLKASAVPGPYYGVFSPKAIYNVKKSLTNSFVNPYGSDVANQAMREGYIGRIAGIDIFETSNVVQESAGNAVNAVFSRDALGLAVMQDIRIATQRDESLRADEVVATAVYGVSELHDTYGIKLLGDNQIN